MDERARLHLVWPTAVAYRSSGHEDLREALLTTEMRVNDDNLVVGTAGEYLVCAGILDGP
jgi:hypothetical protein